MENIPLDSKKKFHVFLNFRGEDVRKNLVEHLYESLSNAGLRVFLDSEELGKGKIIESALRIAIERSDILIPIFSKGYANSTWCLREAAWMCSSNALIIPLFYDVQPCDVKYPVKKGSPYAKAFEEHYSHLDRHDINTIEQWKKALHQISCRSGWSMEAESGYQGRLVKTIVRDVINKLRSVPFVVAEHPVGLERDKKKLIQKLNLSLIDNVVRLGICGIGGIGKTTMAKAVYNEIHREFDASCFVFNVGATAENITGLMELQRRILNDLVDYHGEVPSVDHGKSLTKDRLRGVRALVILDDLNHKSQLNALGGDWFAPGSRVIITSRDQHILNLGNVVSIHQMNGLAQDEAIQLFSWHAFSRVSPDTPYEELSPRIAKACCGHPLSLEVIGSHLYDKKAAEDIDCWEEALHNIATSGDIFRVLRISFDELCAVEREIFLDIACYFIGEKKRDSIIFWEALYQKKAQTAVKNLAQRMLIKISGPHHLLGMHDLLRDMGRGILEQTGNNSRLWLPRDAQTVFSRDRRHPMSNTMLAYIGEKRREPVSLPSMPHLRYLFLQNTKVVGNMGKLAPNLIWIRIRNCEFVIDMTRMEELCRWLTLKNKLHFIGSWSQLRILTLEECACLTALPNTMGNLSQLKQLNVHQCTGLDNLPETIGNLMQLEVLDLSRCTGLGSLPNTMGNLAQLEKLDLRGCAGLGSLPDTMGNLVQLKRLYLRRCTGIRRLPEMVGKLAQLHKLDLHGCTRLESLPDTVGNLVQLQWLDLRWCRCLESLPSTMENLSQLFGLDLRGCTGLGSLPSTIGNLEKLWELDLRGCTGLRILPDTVGNLVQLQRLYLRGCTGLGILPETLGNLVQIQQLDLRGCTSLECLPDMVGSLVQIQELVLSRCVGLRSLPEKVDKLVQLKELYLHGCTSLASLPKKLGNLSQLQLLDLTGCTCLGSLPDTIGSLSQLQLLELSGCTYLESIPNTIGNLTQLERLNLSGCERLGSLPYKVGSLIQLEQVDLSSCAGLRSLPDTIGNLVQLKKLDLSRCRHLGSLPNTVGNLVQLRQLDLSDCAHLRSLPHTVGNLGQLRQLDLSGCARLGSLPHTVGNLGQLRQLHLSGCARLGSLPNTMGNLALLKWLNLTGCAHLGSLPNTIGNLAKLLKLDLHGCVRLGSLPHTVGTLTQLKRLYLTRSESTEGPPNIDTIGTSAKLQQFDLIELAKLRIFLSPSTDMEGTLAQLKWLDLHKCGSLPRLPDIAGNLAQLQWLGLSGCPSLENIPNMIDNL